MVTSREMALDEFPEVTTIVSRIGRPEIATDPMGVNMSDTYFMLKPEGRVAVGHFARGTRGENGAEA